MRSPYENICTFFTGTLHTSLEDAWKNGVQDGEVVWLRDLENYVHPNKRSSGKEKGCWQIRPYRVIEGTPGKALIADYRLNLKTEPEILPPVVEIDLNLEGYYAIWIGIPHLDLIDNHGLDAALDGEVFTLVGIEQGTRNGRFLGEPNAEYLCYFKCADLTGRKLRLQIPYGTTSGMCWGYVGAAVSSIKLIKLSDEQTDYYKKDIANPAYKKIINLHDGFSPYFYATPGCDIDARFVEQHKNTDTKILMLQTPCTGVASWGSSITNLIGDNLSDDEWKVLRLGDRRIYDYHKWSVANGRVNFRVMAEECKKGGIEFHASIRMNLFFSPGFPGGTEFPRMANGTWWENHPEFRKRNAATLNYAIPAVRKFMADILCELVQAFDPAGINLDFTRWPPVLDPQTHDFDVLFVLIEEIKTALLKCNPGLQISAVFVNGYHANMTLEEQKIDYPRLVQSGLLDFIALQTRDHTEFAALAHKAGLPYFAALDQDSPYHPFWRLDPLWNDGSDSQEDPLPGEELRDRPPLQSANSALEKNMLAHKAYQQGADGLFLINDFMGERSMLHNGHVDEIQNRIENKTPFGIVKDSPIFFTRKKKE
jgi:hypothetical protein